MERRQHGGRAGHGRGRRSPIARDANDRVRDPFDPNEQARGNARLREPLRAHQARVHGCHADAPITHLAVERLGEGGCGRVYRAEMEGAGGFTKVVALKLLTESPEADPEGLLKRLRDEARILGLLRHRAVVHADSLVLTNAGWCTVMEYVEGVDLTTIEKSRIPIRPVLEIVEEIASALDAAWNQPKPDGSPLNLVHRDILEPDGATFKSHYAKGDVEFLATPDEWFRPVDLANGPDGALYVVDMYRAVIEHPEWVPAELKTRPDLHFGIDRGRIYRIVSKERR